MKSYIVTLFQCGTLQVVATSTVKATSLDAARTAGVLILKPKINQFVGAEPRFLKRSKFYNV